VLNHKLRGLISQFQNTAAETPNSMPVKSFSCRWNTLLVEGFREPSFLPLPKLPPLIDYTQRKASMLFSLTHPPVLFLNLLFYYPSCSNVPPFFKCATWRFHDPLLTRTEQFPQRGEWDAKQVHRFFLFFFVVFLFFFLFFLFFFFFFFFITTFPPFCVVFFFPYIANPLFFCPVRFFPLYRAVFLPPFQTNSFLFFHSFFQQQ